MPACAAQRTRLRVTFFGFAPVPIWSALGAALASGAREKTEELRTRTDQEARLARLEGALIGLHRPIEGEEVRILAERFGEDAVALGVAFALDLVGLAAAPRLSARRRRDRPWR